jgi:predicted amidophosphoribosyltransferase
MVGAWKGGSRRDLDLFFAAAAERAAFTLASVLRLVEGVVPIPPHRRSVRARGIDLTMLLARAVASGLSGAGRHPEVARLLVNRGEESRARGDRARWINATHGLQAAERVAFPEVVFLVDDVITTGASLARAVDILEGRGVAVVGALTLAATPPRSRPGLPSQR